MTALPASPIAKGVLLRLLLLIALLAAAAYLFDFSLFSQALNGRLLLAGLALQPFNLLCLVCMARRHAILVRRPPAPFGVALAAIVLSTGLNIIIPARLSELVKVTYLRQHAGIPLSHGLAALLLGRLGDIIVFGALGIFAVATTVVEFDWRLSLALSGAALATLFVIPWIAIPARALARLTRSSAIEGFIEHFFAHASVQVRTGTIIKAMLLGAAGTAASLAGIVAFLMVQPFGALTFPQMAATFSAVMFAAAIPALPAGFGAYEAAAILVLTHLGFSVEQALALGLAMHISQLATSGLPTPFLIAWRPMGIAGLVRDLTARRGS